MYDEATARKILRDAPVRLVGSGGEGEAGFDPDDAALDNVYHDAENGSTNPNIRGVYTPLMYFCWRGDLRMCRYLVSRGASTTKWLGDKKPMEIVALKGHVDIGKLLYANGAQDHVRLVNTDGWTPFLYAAHREFDDFARWLVLHGALCHDDSSDEVDGDLIHGLNRWADEETYPACRRLVDWSKDVLQAHSSMVTFLLGTLPPTPEKDRGCILQCLSGHPGIRKNIADFVGLEVTKAKQLCILRSVVRCFLKR